MSDSDPVLGSLAPADVRVRFSPSPTGNPHVGLVRTALFNWAFARHYGGTLVLRIEDTDVARDSEESYAALLDSLRWLGLTWDEGPEVGGPDEPYRQSQRMELFSDVAARLHAAGHAYECFCSPDELELRRENARKEGRTSGYDGHCRALSPAEAEAYRAQGRVPVLRFRMPGETTTFDDLVRGEITFEAEHVPDYVIVRGNGHPLYPLVNPVDDAAMRITHVLRGEDLLSSTPRQIAMHAALRDIGFSTIPTPRFGHLPYVMGEGNRKLSKRDPASSLLLYRERGFLPEGLLNYLALLGWSIGDDREIFTLEEMAQAFDIRRVNLNPARFDTKKLEAINGVRLRGLPAEEVSRRLLPYLHRAQLVSDPPSPASIDLLSRAVPLIHERITVLSEGVDMLRFLFLPDDQFLALRRASGVVTADAREPLTAAYDALAALDTWEAAAIEAALRSSLVEGLGLKPKHAFGPVRTALTGARVSPPLFESMELLGRASSLARLRTARDEAAA